MKACENKQLSEMHGVGRANSICAGSLYGYSYRCYPPPKRLVGFKCLKLKPLGLRVLIDHIGGHVHFGRGSDNGNQRIKGSGNLDQSRSYAIKFYLCPRKIVFGFASLVYMLHIEC